MSEPFLRHRRHGHEGGVWLMQMGFFRFVVENVWLELEGF